MWNIIGSVQELVHFEASGISESFVHRAAAPHLTNAKLFSRVIQDITQKPMITLYMQKAKDRCVARELAPLRASNPRPPMVSHLNEECVSDLFLLFPALTQHKHGLTTHDGQAQQPIRRDLLICAMKQHTVVDGASVKPETADAEQQAVSESRRRVNRRGGHKCPICGQVYADVAQHLRSTENVTNQTELALLSKLAHRHFTTNLDCPVQFCNAKHINRLDKHLQKIHRLEKPMITLYMQKAKDRYVTKELALLRASNPTPPMVSHLDELDDVAVEEGSQASSEAHSEHTTTSAPPPPTSCSEAPCAHSTPKRPLPSHSASESPNEPGTSGMHFHSFSKMATPDKLAMPLLGEPSPGCRNCQVLFAELERVKQLLKGEIKRNLELNQPHSSRSRSSPVQCKRRKPFSPSKAPQYVRLVEEFRGHLEGVNPTRKARENAKQQATHVIHFLEFMADPAVLNADLLFLSNPDKVCAFIAHLQERQFKPTTQKLYLLDVVAFLKYILNTSPSIRLGTEGISALLVELRAHLRDIGRDIVEHQPTMRQSKSAKRRKMSKECKKANVPRKTYLLRKKETPVVSSSEDDGTDDWKPAKTSSEGDSEVEEEPVKGRKVVKQKRALGPVRRRRKHFMTSIEDDRKSIEKSREYSENDSDEEEKQERRMVPKESENKMVASPVQPREVKVSIEDKRTLSPCLQLKTAIVRVNPVTLKTSEMQQVCVSRGTASILEKLPSTVVCDGTSKVKRKILNQSSPFKVSSSTGHSKRHRVRSTSVQTTISGSMRKAGLGAEAVIKEEVLEKKGNEGEKGQGGEADVEEEEFLEKSNFKLYLSESE